MIGHDAVILLSGGIDSVTAAAIAKQQGFALHALSFHYGQRHERELDSASRIAEFLQTQSHRVIRFDLRAIGGLALSDAPNRSQPPRERGIYAGKSGTFRPGRHTIFLFFSLHSAEGGVAHRVFFWLRPLQYPV